ncbi:RNA-binding ATPase activator esf2 [Alternaria rosae]|nr:RNA-binding ATPase activator esf2 [Alternaria rosae]
MATRKRNEYLDVEESEDEERGYDSEDESRARMLPASKRQKVDHVSDSEGDVEEVEEDEEQDFDEDDAEEGDDDEQHAPKRFASKSAELAHLEKLAASLPSEMRLQTTKLGKALPPSSLKKDKSGVIYLSRVPPFMKPAVMRSLLTPYGAVGRIFLTPEDSTSRTQRLRNGGTRRKLFLDGWVEFLHKRDAKFVAENLNAQTMGGKKRGRWHDEVWNIRYLSGVKWHNLVEQIQNENAERAARLRFEISQGKKENKAFLENVERGKMASGIEATRRRRGEDVDGDNAAVEATTGAVQEEGKQKRRKGRLEFSQHTTTSKAMKKPEPGQDVNRVLSSMM